MRNDDDADRPSADHHEDDLAHEEMRSRGSCAYFGESGMAIDAEYTITMPRPQQRDDTHSSDWS